MAEAHRLLLIDDEPAIRKFLAASVDPREYEIVEAANGAAGVRLAATENPSVVLLDLGLPDMDGIEVAQRIREWSQVPIIVLSARGQEKDKVAALDAGADDYLTKPFGVKELFARIRVALRRSERQDVDEPVIRVQQLAIDLTSHTVSKAGREVHLTPIEFRILAVLAHHVDKVVTHSQLLREVWGPGYSEETHYVRVYVQQIRAKIETDPSRPELIATESGVGYRLRSEPATS